MSTNKEANSHAGTGYKNLDDKVKDTYDAHSFEI
jgi:hypothetical protein